jgi:hypothetical protein
LRFSISFSSLLFIFYLSIISCTTQDTASMVDQLDLSLSTPNYINPQADSVIHNNTNDQEIGLNHLDFEIQDMKLGNLGLIKDLSGLDALTIDDRQLDMQMNRRVDMQIDACISDPMLCNPEDQEEDCSRCGSCGLQNCSLWYSPSNAHLAGGSLPDFLDIFEQANQWTHARQMTGVLYLRASTLRKWSEGDFIETSLIPRLHEWNMRLALDVNGATWASCWADRSAKLNPDVRLIDRIIAGGGHIDYVALQSVLSKPLPNPLPDSMSVNCPPYTMRDRYQDVIWYTQEIRQRYPNIQVGLIDALTAHGNDTISIFRALQQALEAESLFLDFVHFDHPYHHGESNSNRSWHALALAESYAREELGWSTGINYVSSTGASLSEQRYHDDVLASRVNFIAAGGRPDWNIINSWYTIPRTELPENAVNSYPMTRILKDMGEAIRLDNTAPHGRAGRVNEAGIVSGWAIDFDNPSQSIRVSLYLDGPIQQGLSLGTFIANTPRDDVNLAMNVAGQHGYSISIDSMNINNQEHLLYIYAHDSRGLLSPIELAGSPIRFTLTP